jgi:hypothetical protein
MNEETAMKDRRTKTALRVVHRNDRAQIKRVLAGSGRTLLPMLELLGGAQASIDELMHDTAVALVEQLLVLSAQDLAGAKQRGRDGGAVLPEAAGTVGVSKSTVSRRFIEASAAQLAALNGRSLAGLAVLGLYIDGIVVHEHMPRLALGASENAQVVKDLLRLAIKAGHTGASSEAQPALGPDALHRVTTRPPMSSSRRWRGEAQTSPS